MSTAVETTPTPESGIRAAVWPLRLMAVVLATTGIVPLANYVTLGRPLRYWAPAVHQWLGWAVIILALAILLARLAPARCEAFVARGERLLLRPTVRQFALLLGLLTFGLVLFFSWRLFHWQPVTIDELSQEWQARLLITGHLFARAEAHDEFFSTMQTLQLHDRWFPQFPIGGAALLGVGMAVGAPWLVNPLLAACAAVAIYRFVAAIATDAQARSVALLFALSPFALFISASQLNHSGTLAAVWMAIAALPRWLAARDTTESLRPGAIIGLGLGAAAAIRPYDAALAALVIGLFQLRHAWTRRWFVKSLVVQTLVGAAPLIILLAANWATTGHPLLFAYDVLNGPEHRPGFHMSPLGFEHTPRHGLYVTSLYLMRLNIVLLGWPVPALVLVVTTLLLQRRATWADHLLLALLGAVVLGYALYWAEGSFQGPRFLFTALPVFLVYVARLPGTLRERAKSPLIRAAVAVLVPLWLLAAWLSPVSRYQPFGVWSLSERAVNQDSVAVLISDAARRSHLVNAVVFLPDGWHARLAARLRKLGARPYNAQLIVGHYDACALQHILDRVDATHWPLGRQTDYVFGTLDQMPMARVVPGLSALEQLALATDRPLPASCRGDFDRAHSNGVDLARLLPREEFDAMGRLGGAVVYARDFGSRNELLRDRFGDRAWYTAIVSRRNDTLSVVLAPYSSTPAGPGREVPP